MGHLKKLTKRQTLARYAKSKREVLSTGLGHWFRFLRYIGLARLTVRLMRRPWHIGDEYIDGKLIQPIIIEPRERAAKRTAKKVEEVNAAAAEQAKRMLGDVGVNSTIDHKK